MRSRVPFSLGAALIGMMLGGVGYTGQGASGTGGGRASTGNIDVKPLDRRHRGKGQNNRRGKGAVAKARKRPNMRTISKRVRAKHRRAARAR